MSPTVKNKKSELWHEGGQQKITQDLAVVAFDLLLLVFVNSRKNVGQHVRKIETFKTSYYNNNEPTTQMKTPLLDKIGSRY